MSSSNSHDQLWRDVSATLEPRIGRDAFRRWFSSVRLCPQNEDAVAVLVPDSIHQLWIESNYMPTLRESFWTATGRQHEITLQVNGDLRTVEPVAEPVPAVEEVSAEAAPATDPEPECGAQPNRIFDTFVVGTNNQFAHAAARAAANSPGSAYNPLFLVGSTGLGKTHLLHAVGTEIMRTRPKLKVVYVTSEDFTNQFIDALRTNTLTKFRDRFRRADVLLIDDVQFLASKERSQEEFFHTFNALFDGHKQIVLSSDRLPAEINGLEERLVSRFEWGMTAMLTPPDYETRLAILRNRTAALRLDLPGSVLEFVAENIRSNVRRLHGSLFRLGSWLSLHGTPSLTDTEEILRDILADEAKNQITIDLIQRTVAEFYDIRLADMTSRKRPAQIAKARQLAMYLTREHIGSSYMEIGEAFGGRDHATVMHACRVMEAQLPVDEKLRHAVTEIERTLQRTSNRS